MLRPGVRSGRVLAAVLAAVALGGITHGGGVSGTAGNAAADDAARAEAGAEAAMEQQGIEAAAEPDPSAPEIERVAENLKRLSEHIERFATECDLTSQWADLSESGWEVNGPDADSPALLSQHPGDGMGRIGAPYGPGARRAGPADDLPDARAVLALRMWLHAQDGDAPAVLARFDELGAEHRLETAEALARSIRDRHADLILEHLGTYPELAAVVLERRWERDAAETLIEGLEHRDPTQLPLSWLQAAALLRDEATYPALRRRLIEGPDHIEVYDAVRHHEGFALEEAVAAGWRYVQREATIRSRSRREMALLAAVHGHVSALPDVLDEVKDNRAGHWARAEAVIARHVDRQGSIERIAAWVGEHQHALVWDAGTARYVLDSERARPRGPRAPGS